MKEKLQEEKELRQKAEDMAETRGAELEGARALIKGYLHVLFSSAFSVMVSN